jgi:hypothetical protein
MLIHTVRESSNALKQPFTIYFGILSTVSYDHYVVNRICPQYPSGDTRNQVINQKGVEK